MTVRILVDRKHLIDLLGVPFERELTFPHIFKDSVYAITPVVVESDGGARHVVTGDFDSAAHAAATGDIPFSTWGRYFSWNHNPDAPHDSFVTALRKVAGPGELQIEALMPVSRYEALAASGPVSVFDRPVESPVHVWTKSRSEIAAALARTRDCDVPRLAGFVSGLPAGKILLPEISRPPVGHEALDDLVTGAGLSGIYLTAAFDIEMFTGLPQAEVEDLGLSVWYVPGQDAITVFSVLPVTRGDFAPAGTAPGRASALAGVATGRIGFQRDNLSIGSLMDLQAAGVTGLVDATEIIRHWNELRAETDLLYYITAGNAVLAGIRHAESFIRNRISGGITEREVQAVYHQGVQDFAASIGMEGRIHPYFDIIHPGERTLLPAMAGDYPIRPTDRTIKFDMGLLVTDSTGIVRGCSDISRTISLDPELQAIHDRLRRALVDTLIPAIRPGMSGSEIHAIGIEAMRPLTGEMRRLGLLHDDMTIEGYTRDCGHTLQRQTLATVHFIGGFPGKVQAHMLGCTEFVWPIDDMIISCEDGYYITPDGAVPFTE